MKSMTFIATHVQKPLLLNPPPSGLYIWRVPLHLAYYGVFPQTWGLVILHSQGSRPCAFSLSGTLRYSKTQEGPVVLPSRLTYQVGEKQVVDLLSHPSHGSKRNDHGHEVLTEKQQESMSTPSAAGWQPPHHRASGGSVCLVLNLTDALLQLGIN